MSIHKGIIAVIVAIFAGIILLVFFSMSKVKIEQTIMIEEANIAEIDGEFFLLLDDRQLTLQDTDYEAIIFGQSYKVLYEQSIFDNSGGDVLRVDEMSFPPRSP